MLLLLGSCVNFSKNCDDALALRLKSRWYPSSPPVNAKFENGRTYICNVCPFESHRLWGGCPESLQGGDWDHRSHRSQSNRALIAAGQIHGLDHPIWHPRIFPSLSKLTVACYKSLNVEIYSSDATQCRRSSFFETITITTANGGRRDWIYHVDQA